jgi:dGTPase
VDGGYDHAVWGADVVVTSLNLCAQTIDGIRNHSWSRPAPSTPEGEVVSWADRIAYVCHDFEDAAHTGIVNPADLPELVRERCGTSRSSQLNAFIVALVDAIAATGTISMRDDTAEALAVFRRWNYENIYMRSASQEQALAVTRMLQALVEHFADTPSLLPGALDAERRSPESYRAAVTYVGGMTDRFACENAVVRLGWPRSELPQGIGVAR